MVDPENPFYPNPFMQQLQANLQANAAAPLGFNPAGGSLTPATAPRITPIAPYEQVLPQAAAPQTYYPQQPVPQGPPTAQNMPPPTPGPPGTPLTPPAPTKPKKKGGFIRKVTSIGPSDLFGGGKSGVSNLGSAVLTRSMSQVGVSPPPKAPKQEKAKPVNPYLSFTADQKEGIMNGTVSLNTLPYNIDIESKDYKALKKLDPDLAMVIKTRRDYDWQQLQPGNQQYKPVDPLVANMVYSQIVAPLIKDAQATQMSNIATWEKMITPLLANTNIPAGFRDVMKIMVPQQAQGMRTAVNTGREAAANAPLLAEAISTLEKQRAQQEYMIRQGLLQQQGAGAGGFTIPTG